MKRRLVIGVLALLATPLFAANINLPTFQLLTRGRLVNGLFPLDTRARIELALTGGYKVGGELVLALSDDNLGHQLELSDTYDSDEVLVAVGSTLLLELAQVRLRNPFELPLEVRYFVGTPMLMLNGDVFPEVFGTEPIASAVRGVLYFPDGVQYDGIHAVSGTGFALATSGAFERAILSASVYQDQVLGAGIYSADLCAALNWPAVKLEAFAGASFPVADYGAYRGGILLFYDTGETGEFLTQVGVTRWAPVTDGALNIDDFFFLFEPRVHLGAMSILLTLFWHPEYYQQAETGERGSTDIITKFVVGNALESTVSGGLETGLTLRPVSGAQQFTAAVSPFVRVNAAGVVWDLKTRIKLFPFAWDDIVEVYLGIRTQF